MPPRSRQKLTDPYRYKLTFNSSPYSSYRTHVRKKFVESNYPGSNECEHLDLSYGSGHVFTYNNVAGKSEPGNAKIYVEPQGPFVFTFDEVKTSIRNHIPIHSLNWTKLESSSEFGFLQALAEYDETIAMFTRKFWRELSYGSITWGVLPFISELNALVEQGRALMSRAPNNQQGYEDEVVTTVVDERFPFRINRSSYNAHLRMEVTSRYSGGITIPTNFLLEGLDRIGFHPDLATAWDLIPLSFVVDYLFPIGDFLENFADRGWIKAVNFTGWHTSKATGVFTGLDCKGYHLDEGLWAETVEFEYFHRSYHNSYVLLDQPNDSSVRWFELPRPREFLNVLYLRMASRRRN